jgi:hypothetical protein
MLYERNESMLPDLVGSELSLETLLASLRSNEDISEKFNYANRFKFVHDPVDFPSSLSFIL